MVKTQPIKNITKRLDYIYCEGDYKNKEQELITSFDSPDYPSEAQNFYDLDYQLKDNRNSRKARELQISIPHKLKGDIKAQQQFVQDYMHRIQDAYAIPKEKHLWTCAIHQKRNPDGNLNIHAHLLMSERLKLPELQLKTMKARHYKNYDVPKHEKWISFGDKMTTNINGKKIALFETKEFAKKSNEIWRDLVKEKGLKKHYDELQQKPINLIPYRNHYSCKNNFYIRQRNIEYNKQVKKTNSFINKYNLENCIATLFSIGSVPMSNVSYSIKEFQNRWDNLSEEERLEILKLFNQEKEQEISNDHELEL